MNDMSKIGGHAISVHKYKTLLEDKLITQRNKKAYSVYTISFAKVLQISELCNDYYVRTICLIRCTHSSVRYESSL